MFSKLLREVLVLFYSSEAVGKDEPSCQHVESKAKGSWWASGV